MPGSIPGVDCAVRSDSGRDPEKQLNEDSADVRAMPFGLAAVVCDGMGGHAAGEQASRAAVAAVLDVLSTAEPPLERLLASALIRAHAEVAALGGSAPIDARPGSTAAVLALSGREAFVAHVGDSRVYRVRAGRTERLTRDHSVVEMLMAKGAISEAEAKNHPDANRITRALGIGPEVAPEVSPPIQVQAADIFVLCSDGLSDLVSDEEIASIVSGAAAATASQALVDLANQRGGHDNITALVVAVRAETARARSNTAMPVDPTELAGGPTLVDRVPLTVAMDGLGTVPTLPDQPSPLARTVVEPGLTDASPSPAAPATVEARPVIGPTVVEAPRDPRTTVETLPPAGFAPTGAAPSAPPVARRHREGRVMFWLMLAVCAAILLAIVAWWLASG